MDLGWIARALDARSIRIVERIQALWGGFGELFRIELDGTRTAIVKWARSGGTDVSSLRKARSFDVETAFYKTVAPRCDETCRVPALLASRSGDREWWLVLEDLDAAGYTGRADEAGGHELDAILGWLASFHARFIGERFSELWPIGTYWHLDTRREELAAIADRALRDAAPRIAADLAGARYQTLLHGDAKDANFCFARTGAVAAVDFQYTGHGCAMSDVAYLLYGRADEPAGGIDHRHLDTYFAQLRSRLPATIDADALEHEWRALYPTARLDYRRFLAGWRPGR